MKIIAPFGTDMVSGSYGSVTFARNRGGLYVRSRVVPTNPSSPEQVAQRTAMVYASQLWRTLTPAEKADWNNWAGNNPIRDRLGSEVTLSGQQAFVLVNTRLRTQGIALILEPPVNPAPEPLATLSMVEGIGPPTTIDLVFTTTPVGANDFLIVRAAKVSSAGISYVKNQYRLLVREPAAASPFDIKDLVIARLGAVTEGEIVHVAVSVGSADLLYSGDLLAQLTLA